MHRCYLVKPVLFSGNPTFLPLHLPPPPLPGLFSRVLQNLENKSNILWPSCWAEHQEHMICQETMKSVPRKFFLQFSSEGSRGVVKHKRLRNFNFPYFKQLKLWVGASKQQLLHIITWLNGIWKLWRSFKVWTEWGIIILDVFIRGTQSGMDY